MCMILFLLLALFVECHHLFRPSLPRGTVLLARGGSLSISFPHLWERPLQLSQSISVLV